MQIDYNNMKNSIHKQPEIWAGIECTVNRVEDDYRDQLQYTGHYTRSSDIEQFAQLGIKALRYPVLWEIHKPRLLTKPDWRWIKKQLETIRRKNIIPIAGLLHHGSGPRYTNLFKNDFAALLAEYAFEVAKQFPWIQYYTPVNEPLTTARFSGLYGHWYPHHKSEYSFYVMLLNQLKGTILSMKAIRTINAEAKLVQTEDLGKTHSTPLLSYQAEYENKRNLLTFDILCGNVTRDHIFWNYFVAAGIKESMLEFFIENPCPPDVIGLNYYITSERYLDENIHLYHKSSHGGNNNHRYADITAVRSVKPEGLEKLMEQMWQRYRLPLALTEVHLNCTREEQLRWFKEAWDTCCSLIKKGTNVKAITAWALLGSYDWGNLLTRNENKYESGIFDLVNNKLRPTALTTLIKDLSGTGSYTHPLIIEKGWWHKSYPGASSNFTDTLAKPLLVLGSNGTLGTAICKICERRSIPFKQITRNELDITSADQFEKVISSYKPWAVINATGYVRVDDAETDVKKCFEINAEGPALLAEECCRHGIKFMSFSSDLVFGGDKETPYLETDEVRPLNVYGNSKVKGESMILNKCSSALVIRTSAFFGPWDQYNFPAAVLRFLKDECLYTVAKDVIVSPTYIPDLIDKALDLFIDDEKGIWHLTNEGMVSWSGFAEEIAERSGYKKKYLIPVRQDEMKWKARRPSYSALQNVHGIKLPSLSNAINRFFEEKIN
jgi:dTDP-4-dehydrorhamnose reductase